MEIRWRYDGDMKKKDGEVQRKRKMQKMEK